MTILATPAPEVGELLSDNDSARAGVTVLIVDDNPVDRRLTGSLVEKHTGSRITYARNGREALESIAHQPPTLVLTDLLMPEMDGLELVETVRDRYPLVPVILMTAFGSEDVAIEALQKGAASYVPKKSLGRDIAATFEQVLAAAQASHHEQQLREFLTCLEAQFDMATDPALVPALIAHLQAYPTRLNLCDETARIRVGIALEEALTNAIYHGNLELSSDLRQDGSETYYRLAAQRRHQPPYQDRRVHVTIRVSRTEAVYRVRDEGLGFDPSTLPDPTDPANLGKTSGRGLLLIRTFMDEVSYNDRGNEITLIKRRDANPKV
jgi:CheY-like chemotaxis protein/anti-sigma regulatory factor (Ser/Thr protein kinase)